MSALEGGAALPVTTGGTGQTEARAAVPVYVVSGGPVIGQRARRVVVVTSGPVEGGAARPVYDAGSTALYSNEPALPVFVVSGSLGASVAAPANSVLPVVSGTAELGQTLTTTDGTWTGSPTFTYQWKRGGVAIGGATNSTYVLVAADMGTTITAEVTGTNAGGSAAASSAGTSIPNYSLLDRFTTNAVAPLTSPRNCEPGPGTLTLVDPASQLSISSSILQVAGGSGAGWDRGFYSATGIARFAGRGLLVAVTQASGSAFGPAVWSRSAALVSPAIAGNADHGIRANAGNYWTYVNGAVGVQRTGLGSEVALVLRAAGAFYLQKVTSVWTLEWVDNAQNTATLFPEMVNFNGVGTIDDFRVVDLGGDWATAYGLATSRTAITVANTTGLMTANGIVEHTITAATGVTQELVVRRTDDDNCWIIRMNQGASTIAIIERNATVETSRNSVAQTWTNGTPYRVVVVCFGNTIETYVANVAKNAYASAAFNNTATGVKVSHAGVDLVAWPRVPTVPNF